MRSPSTLLLLRAVNAYLKVKGIEVMAAGPTPSADYGTAVGKVSIMLLGDYTNGLNITTQFSRPRVRLNIYHPDYVLSQKLAETVEEHFITWTAVSFPMVGQQVVHIVPGRSIGPIFDPTLKLYLTSLEFDFHLSLL